MVSFLNWDSFGGNHHDDEFAAQDKKKRSKRASLTVVQKKTRLRKRGDGGAEACRPADAGNGIRHPVGRREARSVKSGTQYDAYTSIF
jgi:hypothetical protein